MSESTLFKFRLPDIGEGVAEGEIVRWLVPEGASLTEDQPLCEVMTDKVTVEVPSPLSGTLVKQMVPEGTILAVEAELAWIEPASHSDSVAATHATTSHASGPVQAPTTTPTEATTLPMTACSPHPATTVAADHKVLAAPATRKLARSLGVSLSQVVGTGPRGRVTPADVQQASAGGRSSGGTSLPPLQASPQPMVALTDRVVPYAGMRRVIGDRLSLAKQTIPEFVLIEEVNVTRLVTLREELKPVFTDRYQLKLTYLPFILKALVNSLQAFPALNTQLTDQQIVYKSSLDLGVAVDVPQGLVVPVIRQAHTLSLAQLAGQLDDLATRARAGQLSRTETTGSTFTITSIGSIGGVAGIPIINPPEAAILAINRIRQAPVVTPDNQLAVGSLMNLTLTCDHRLVDGATAARFLTHLRLALEQPASLLI